MNSRFSILVFNDYFRVFGLAGLLAVSGCGRNDVQVYRLAKDNSTAPAPDASGGALPPGHPDTSGGAAQAQAQAPRLKWTLPAGWEEVAPGEMRLASFHVKEGNQNADVSVVPLPGMAGGTLANVNRWRGQVGQSAVSESDLSKIAEPVEIGGLSGQLFDQAGVNASSGDKARILAAILQRDDAAWFFKMTGDDELVAKQKPAFIAFLKSLSFAAPGEMASAPAAPMNATLMSAMPAAGGDSGAGKPTWETPAGWQEVPGGQFLVAKFTIDPATSVNVSSSGGTGGGLSANVNRWRGQLGLSQLSEDEVNGLAKPIDTSGGKAMLVDMTGTDARTGQKARLIGAIVPQGGQTWFYKLMGNEKTVEGQKDAFTKFVQTAKY